MMNYETYRIEKYDMCRDDSHAVIACYEYENENEDKKILRLLIRGNSLIPTPSNEINAPHNVTKPMYAIYFFYLDTSSMTNSRFSRIFTYTLNSAL